MSHLPLDARAILHYLNELGYRNISAVQLKEFLKDLRKLIKYEERLGVNNQQNDYYESLFKRTTASYRAKCDREIASKRTPAEACPGIEPSCSRRAAAGNRKVLRTGSNGPTSTSSFDLSSSVYSSRSPEEKQVLESKTDKKCLKLIAEKILAQVLSEKYCQEFVDREQKHPSEEKSPLEFMIEQTLKEKLNKLRHPLRQKQSTGVSDAGTLRAIIEDIVGQVLKERFPNIQTGNRKCNADEAHTLNQDLEQKLTISYNQDKLLSREPVTHYNNNRPLDRQVLVQELLTSEKTNLPNKQLKQSKADQENTKTPPKACGIKRLQRSPRKKPEWQDPSLRDKIVDKPLKTIRPQSPTVSSSVRSGRSSSVLIPRAKSVKRKPISDPVALYQYYKAEWEHFRNQIPGEASHDRLRWNVRQRLLDPE